MEKRILSIIVLKWMFRKRSMDSSTPRRKADWGKVLRGPMAVPARYRYENHARVPKGVKRIIFERNAAPVLNKPQNNTFLLFLQQIYMR